MRPIQEGRIKPRARTVVLRETAATAVLHAAGGLLMPGGEVVLDLDDEIQRAVVVSHGGRVVQPRIRALLQDSKEIHS